MVHTVVTKGSMDRNRKLHRRSAVIAASALAGVMVLAGCGATSSNEATSSSEIDRNAGAEAAAGRGAKQWSPTNWMENLFASNNSQTDGNVMLKDIAIPGSHDSGTFKVDEILDVCDPPAAAKVFPSIGRRWARAQTDNLYDQARAGVRAFDIRPVVYKSDGRQILSTCHSADAAKMWEVFSDVFGLVKFAKENPKEVLFINLSHFAYADYPRDEAASALRAFISENVCPLAIESHQYVPDDDRIPARPGDIKLRQMWKAKKQFVVGADSKTTMPFLRNHGCVFELGAEENLKTIRGGYAADSKAKQGGDDARINFWKAYVDTFPFPVPPLPNPEAIPNARKRTEQLLLGNLESGWPGLSETSYIWVYGGDGIDWDDQGRAAIGTTLVDASRMFLWPHAREFIRALDQRAKQEGTNVNIVNMDAIERSNPATIDQFVGPLMEINQRIAPDDDPKPVQEAFMLYMNNRDEFCVGTTEAQPVQRIRLVPCQKNNNTTFKVSRDTSKWQQFVLGNGMCMSTEGEKGAIATTCNSGDGRQSFRWHPDHWGVIQSASDQTKCLDAVYFQKMNSDLEFHQCHGKFNQQFWPKKA